MFDRRKGDLIWYSPDARLKLGHAPAVNIEHIKLPFLSGERKRNSLFPPQISKRRKHIDYPLCLRGSFPNKFQILFARRIAKKRDLVDSPYFLIRHDIQGRAAAERENLLIVVIM